MEAPFTTPLTYLAAAFLMGMKLWRDNRRDERNAQERREEADRARTERRRIARDVRRLRPDRWCQQAGCPMATNPAHPAHPARATRG